MMRRVTPGDGLRVFIGTDPAEDLARQVAVHSLYRHASRRTVQVAPLSMATLGAWYQRPTPTVSGQLFDVISDAPMSTAHAIARFFIPLVCQWQGWALFVDGDVLFRRDVTTLFEMADLRKAVMVVQHPALMEEGIKKTGHLQQAYRRKNWSSVMLVNCGHLANRALTLQTLNMLPGRDLHAFSWLADHEIGALPPEWNYLVHVNPPQDDPALVHYTLGTPNLEGHQGDPFAAEWLRAARVVGYQHPVAFHTEA
jgi:hypothetical protein